MLIGICLAFVVSAFAAVLTVGSPATPARAAPLFAPKPVNGWYVCANLGIGQVPGVPDARQRLRLCHPSGWVVNTYCTQVGLPVPPIGRSCTRINEDTYRCGAGNQRVREYRTLQTPVNTPTATTTQASPTPTLTATTPSSTQPSNRATPTRRPRIPPGGEGNGEQVQDLILVEIGVFLLSAILGLWIVRRMFKPG
jgi:hypothetical protein